MNAYRLTTLTHTDLPDAAALAAAAFSDTPCYNEILPDSDIIQRTAFLSWLFEKNFTLRLEEDCCRCTYDGDTLISFFMFTKPDVRHPTCCDMLRVGLITGAVKYGFTAVKRLLQTKNWMEAKEKEVLSSREVRGEEQQMIRLERMTGKKRRGRNNTGKGSRFSSFVLFVLFVVVFIPFLFLVCALICTDLYPIF
tara:strand:- start:354 stop:938 length:585 start_codon:yes stop_codon:yes gene_type:complete